MKKTTKQQTPMELLTKGYDSFMRGKETVNNSRELFDKAIKKATSKPKQRGSK